MGLTCKGGGEEDRGGGGEGLGTYFIYGQDSPPTPHAKPRHSLTVGYDPISHPANVYYHFKVCAWAVWSIYIYIYIYIEGRSIYLSM